MTYEIAKKLKDAGFPLKPASFESSNDSIRKKQIFYYSLDSLGRDGSWLYPTLSELIEACGNSFGSLHQIIFKESFGGAKWIAEGDLIIDGRIWGETLGAGLTPENSVANLWLQLQNKEITSY